MKIIPFKAGIHPVENKGDTENKEIETICTQKIMIYPLNQHIGAESVPIVNKGDRVLKGSLIAEAASTVSSRIFSSVSGTVKSIENRLTADGSSSLCIIIENDFLDETTKSFNTQNDLSLLNADDIVNIVRSCGIVGLGGAGFPTDVKLSVKDKASIDTVIMNGAECEPYITSDSRLMSERTSNIINGAEAVLKVFPNAKFVFAIENNKPDSIKKITEFISNNKRMSVHILKTRYPQGAERRLIASVTGRKLNSHRLPADVGVIVLNAATVNAVYEAVYLNIPLIHRIVTVSGDCAEGKGNYDVPLGISARHLIEQTGGISNRTVKLICGGPMMGTALQTLDVPVTKTFSSVLAFGSDDVENMPQTPCIRCSKCVGVCPENLVPTLLAAAAESHDYIKFDSLGGLECIECGCCTYICPAKRCLTQMFKCAKAEVKAAKKA